MSDHVHSPAAQPALPLVDGIAGVVDEPTPAAEEHPVDHRSTRSFNLRGRSLRQHAARGTMINTVFLVFLSVIGLLRGFILAAFLTRADYGVWGILVVSLGTILWLKQVGIGDKYIQQDEADQELAFQKAFTLEAMFTGLFMVILAVALPVIAVVYGQWKLIPPGLVLLLVLPSGVLQAPLWVYYRNMEFVRQRTLQAIDPIVGFVVAIGMAWAGAGYWALAAGVLAGGWSAAIAGLLVSPYKLRFRYDRGTMRSYASFSWPLLVANGSSMVIAQSAVIATNAKLGLAGAGTITLAANVTAFTERVDNLVTGTLYPAICTVRDRIALLEESFVKTNRLALMWAVPFGAGLSLFCGDLVNFGLGDRWKPVVTLLQIYGITAAVAHLGFNWDAYMRATGRTRPIAVAGFVSMVTFVCVGLPLLFAFGLRGLAYGVAAQAAAHVACRVVFLRSLFEGFGFARHAVRSFLPALPAIAMVLGARQLEHGHRGAGIAAAELVGYVVVVAVTTIVMERALLREALSYVAGRGSNASGAAPAAAEATA